MSSASSESAVEPAASPVRELLTLAAPTVAQTTSYTAMHFADTAMIAAYGDARGSILEPTAAANAGLASFAVICLGQGTLMIVNTLASQCYGAGKLRRTGRYLWQGIWFAVTYAIAVMPAWLIGLWLFEKAGHSPELAAMEAQYFRLLLIGTVFRGLSLALGQFLIAVDRPVWVFGATVIGIGVNVLLNYALIFGQLGAPQMGLAGAAWATNAAAVVETLVLVAVVAGPSLRRFGVRDWRFRPLLFGKLLKLGLPSGLQFVADVLPWTVFFGLVMAEFGEGAMAANGFAFRYQVTAFLPAVGISVAVTALVGRYVGRRDPATARRRAHLGFVVILIWCTLVAGAYVIFGRELIGVFTSDEAVLELGAKLMLVVAAYQIFDTMYVNYASALRGAGDTLVPAVVTFVTCWAMLMGVALWVARSLPGLDVYGPWAVACVYGVFIGIFMLLRFHLGKWRHGVVDRGP